MTAARPNRQLAGKRILVAKPGLDGHDIGAKIVAPALRDAGAEVARTPAGAMARACGDGSGNCNGWPPHARGDHCLSPPARDQQVEQDRASALLVHQQFQEVSRLKLGRQTHDVAFSPDSRTLYVGHETETFISVIDIATSKVQARLRVDRAQHDLSISADGRELWFSVTNRPYKRGDPRVGVVDLATGKVTFLVS